MPIVTTSFHLKKKNINEYKIFNKLHNFVDTNKFVNSVIFKIVFNCLLF